MNALVLADGSVRLIDFGLADSDHLAAELRPRERGGSAFSSNRSSPMHDSTGIGRRA